MGCSMNCCAKKPGKDTLDSSTGLTGMDIKLIRDSWKQLISRGLTITMGAELFVVLFHTHPYMMSYFGSFDLNRASIGTNHKLGRHALVFMNGIQLFVDYVDKPAPLIALVEKLSLNHLERGVTRIEMDRISQIFVPTIRSQLGATFSMEAADAWKRFFQFFVQVFENVETQVQGIVEKRSHLTDQTGSSQPSP